MAVTELPVYFVALLHYPRLHTLEDWQKLLYPQDLQLTASLNSFLACAYTQPQMLPDVGMVNTYLECL